MTKYLIDPALCEGSGTMNRAYRASGTGHIRVNAADGDGAAEVLIYGEIGGWWDGISAQDFVPEIRAIEAETINVRMNSPGGSVFDGIAIYNAIAQHSAHVVIHIESLAASIASVIAMAGDEIRIGESANIMIHKPWGLVMGDAEDLRAEAGVLDKLQDAIVATYTARTGKTVEELADLVNAETWFLGQEAVDMGFADTLIPNKSKKEKKARANSRSMPLLKAFKNTPAALIVPDDHDAPRARRIENALRDEGLLSANDAKRYASLVNRVLGPDRDDHAPETLPPDEGAIALKQALEAQAFVASLRNCKFN